MQSLMIGFLDATEPGRAFVFGLMYRTHVSHNDICWSSNRDILAGFDNEEYTARCRGTGQHTMVG